MKLGSLFSGGGLGDFGFMAAGMDIAWQCEIDEYCQKILALRYPDSKKYRDIKTLKGAYLEPVDILTGGFPCQPFSVAGKQKGKEDNRYLWPEMLRVIKECRPRWIVGENVPGIINMALDTVCLDLEAEGYEVWPIVFPSHALGAWHKRDRLWIICNATSEGLEGATRTSIQGHINGSSSSSQVISDTRCKHGTWNTEKLETNTSEWSTIKLSLESGCKRFRRFWSAEPNVGRVANGITDRVHRLKMLGNGQVPACTYVIGRMIMDIERGEN